VTLHKLSTFIILLTLFAYSCKQSKVDEHKAETTVVTKKINQDSLRQKLDENIHFIGDSLLKNKEVLLKNYLSKYQTDTCGIIAYSDKDLKEGFEGIKNIGDINGDKIADTVFIVPPFNYCDDGYSYSFFDTTLPRLFTDSYCCHPDNLFSIGDIDEDGTSEICIFYSSCVSRFKSLIAYSLKDGQWKQIGRCTFDINVMKPDKEKRVRKISKGKFEMLEIVINNFDKKPSGDKEWKQFTF
jgi:hypothetical protein